FLGRIAHTPKYAVHVPRLYVRSAAVVRPARSLPAEQVPQYERPSIRKRSNPGDFIDDPRVLRLTLKPIVELEGT
ncbi:hypothetical protein L9F63_021415, partial [Diploptera punctata]